MVKKMDAESGSDKGDIVVSITGASGIQLGIRTIGYLLEIGRPPKVIVSSSANRVAYVESQVRLTEELTKMGVRVYQETDIDADISSSSRKLYGNLIIPTSLKTLGEIANGITGNLVSRVAINALRMRKKLVVVLRETPLGVIELRNALKLAQAGAIILPATIAFYNRPQTVDDIIDFIVGKALDAMEIENDLYKRWSKEL